MEKELFYGWDDSPSGRGRKFHIGNAAQVILTQKCPYDDMTVPTNFQIEVKNTKELYARLAADETVAIMQTPAACSYG